MPWLPAVIPCIWAKFIKHYFFWLSLAFFRLSNLCPRSLNSYDYTRQWAGGDVFWDENSLKILIKWSKTLQSRDKIKIITLPSHGRAAICPLCAFKKWQVFIDSKVRKTLSLINSRVRLHSPLFHLPFL